MGKEQGFRIFFDGMAAMRTFDDAEFIGSNEACSELIDLKRFGTSGTLALHVSHSMLTFKYRKPKIRKALLLRPAETATNIEICMTVTFPFSPTPKNVFL
jgi:hypothetical protein